MELLLRGVVVDQRVVDVEQQDQVGRGHRRTLSQPPVILADHGLPGLRGAAGRGAAAAGRRGHARRDRDGARGVAQHRVGVGARRRVHAPAAQPWCPPPSTPPAARCPARRGGRPARRRHRPHRRAERQGAPHRRHRALRGRGREAGRLGSVRQHRSPDGAVLRDVASPVLRRRRAIGCGWALPPRRPRPRGRASEFWSALTDIPPTQFIKPYRAVADSSIRSRKHPSGLSRR